MTSGERSKPNPEMNKNREALLEVVRTSNILMKMAGRFFSRFVITDVQFNILMILKDRPLKGLTQKELSRRMVVTKSNIVGLIDRLEKSGLVERRSDAKDRRFNHIFITQEGQAVVGKIEGAYQREVDEIMSCLDASERDLLIKTTQKLKTSLILKGENA